ncbi:alpha/beta-hydrolase [Plenodomus tracheiphilus IPT5]|uniref:Alpha/beta-hydrolase n=1 Tax=Plenodomus tracheiphilus IPT5 TaxID=1408161 RepID=A0A6A7AY61_9PLEO|nr:alpha/beta-hydrolase [Plenodomus tracheiphilus IPT5]
MSKLPKGYAKDAINPPLPIAGLIFTIPLTLAHSFFTICSVSLRRLFTNTDVPFGDDIFRSLLRNLIGVTPTTVKRYMMSSPLTNDKTLSTPHYHSYRTEMCQEISTPDFSGYWICHNLWTAMRPPTQAATPKQKKTLLWIHGGAYIVSNPLAHIAQQIRIAEMLAEHGVQLDVFSLRYGLGPEAQFPTQEQQALAAYRYLIDVEKIDARDIIVHGESAGGHLALLLLLALSRSEQRGVGKPGGALLMYPWVNLRNSGDSVERNRFKCMLTRKSLDEAVDAVVGGAEGRERWSDRLDFAAPREEGEASWREILPDRTWVNVGEHDLFADDVQAFARNAERDGAVVFAEVTKGQCHGWQLFEDGKTQSKYCALGSGEEVPKDFMVGSRNLAMGLLQVVKDD